MQELDSQPPAYDEKLAQHAQKSISHWVQQKHGVGPVEVEDEGFTARDLEWISFFIRSYILRSLQIADVSIRIRQAA